MIVRILGEGQCEIAGTHLEKPDELESAVRSAAESGDELEFANALRALLNAVRSLGVPLPNDTRTPSDLALPDEATGHSRVLAGLADKGLSLR
ncbi:PspA-associated protein PspAA [Streptomyces sp. RPT161]|uniref:PspA-associated protein PspAA n=1 Tax=Streptomyces sp. RPT161 TaxID=3015993 RepID=UPI0022B8F480|nr:hypothetical protein [Streptomyces sp. RPT161]